MMHVIKVVSRAYERLKKFTIWRLITQLPEHHAAEMMVFDVLIWVKTSRADRYSDKKLVLARAPAPA